MTQLKANRERLAKVESTMPKLPTAMAVEDRKIEDLAVHPDDYLTLGETAPRGVPMPFDFEWPLPLTTRPAGGCNSRAG